MTPNMEGLPAIPEALVDDLWDAHTRFYVAKGLSEYDFEGELLFPRDMTAADRAAHPAMFDHEHIEADEVVDFMHAVSGISRGLCATWDYLDMIKYAGFPDEALQASYADTLAIVNAEAIAR